MQSRRLTIALTTAFVVSGLLTYLLSRSMTRAAAASQRETLHYLSPARSISPGEVLKSADLKAIPWPATDPIVGAFVKADTVVGRAALYPMEPGQPVLERELSAQGTGTGLASRIPAGMRAIALQSDEIVGVAGFLEPGSRVDVLVTIRGEQSPEPITATVLENSEIIAVGHEVEPDPSGKPVTATVVTLLLSPQEAERALLATSQGQVHFVLRNGADATSTGSRPVALSELSGSAPLARAVQKPRVAPSTSPEPGPKPVATGTPIKRESQQVETILAGQPSKEGVQQ